MKYLSLVIFMFYSTAEKKSYYVKLENFEKYTKYVKIKYENRKGDITTKEVKIKPNGHYGLFVHDSIFYVYSVSFHAGGKVRSGTYGGDGIGFFRTIIKGKTAYYQKIDCEMQLRGFFKTVHLGI